MSFRAGVVAALWLAFAAVGIADAPAQQWPVRPVKVVVSFGAGGTADILGRAIAAELSNEFGQQFYVENKPGAGGAIGSGEVLKAAPDGYTLLIAGAGPQLVGPAVNTNITYDTMRDFTHIALIAGDSYMLAASPKMGARTLAEFISLAKQNPVTTGAPGAGTQGELLQHVINRRLELKLQPVPFSSAADALTSLLGGHIQAAMQPSISLGPYVMDGTAVGLAVTTNERVPAYKDIPTFKELGYDVPGGLSWFWLAGPSKLPTEIVNKLNAAVRKVIASEKVREQFTRSALTTLSLDPAQTAAFIADEVKVWATVAKELGVKLQ